MHCNANSIGGNCVEIATATTRIIVDIGVPLGGPDIDLRNKVESKKYLPPVAGLYQWDGDSAPPDALMISHAHIDHYGFYNFVRKDVPLYLGKATLELIKISALFQNMKMGSIDHPMFIESGKPFEVGDMKVTPWLMDHSGFDAYAFFIEAEGKRILYSGDFRGHGRKQVAFQAFMNKAPEKVDVMILEGTTIGRPESITKTEGDIEGEIEELLKSTPGLVLAWFSLQNADRFVSFYRAAKKAGRTVVTDPYGANVLQLLSRMTPKIPAPPTDPRIKVFFDKKICSFLKRKGLEKLFYKFSKAKVLRATLTQNPAQYLFFIRPSIQRSLEVSDFFKDSVLIYSLWEGYKNKPKTVPFIDFIEKQGIIIKDVHTSGHADIETLKKVVERFKPETLIPIHTTSPGSYKELFNCSIKILKNGEPFRI